MPIHIEELINFLASLCDNKKLYATCCNSLKGGALTGISAFLGGMLLGPVGLAIGGVVGGISSAMAINNYEPVGKILRNMSRAEKEKLFKHFKAAVRDFHVNDIIALSLLISSSSSFESVVMKSLTDFLTNDMKMQIKA